MSSMAAIVEAGVGGGKCDWVAHASGMLVFGVAPKPTSLESRFFESSQRFQQVRHREDALASTRDACATRKFQSALRLPSARNSSRKESSAPPVSDFAQRNSSN
jgi:hypothetical protein